MKTVLCSKKTSLLVLSSMLTFNSSLAMAGQISGPGYVTIVDPSETPETWDVSNEATLKVLGGTTDQIKVSDNGHLIIEGGTVTNNSQGNGGAVTLFGSTAEIDRANISNATGAGLALTALNANESTSTADVSNSTISGSNFGATTLAGSVLNLDNSSVYGAAGSIPATNPAGGGIGIVMTGGLSIQTAVISPEIKMEYV